MKIFSAKLAGSMAAAMILMAPFAAGALSVDDIQSQIKALMQQITELQLKIKVLQSTTVVVDPATPGSTTPAAPASNARICALLNRDLTVGTRGDDVSGLQEFLYEQKILTVAPTGYFGPMTADAVRKWQASEGVTAAGSFGPMSRDRIKVWCGGGGGGYNNSERFSASPTRGAAPLTVVFDTWLSGFRVNTISYSIDFGDGTNEAAASCNAPADACVSPGQNKHTYASNGTYVATLNKITNPCAGQELYCKAAIRTEVVAKQQITVGSTGPVACTMEYAPVCGAKTVYCITTPCNPVPTTYSNKCAMTADGATYLYSGQCKDTTTDPSADRRCKSWYDGCNTCSRNSADAPAMCTLRACMTDMMAKPYCTAYFDDSTTTNKPPTISGFSGPSTLALNTSGTWSINASDPEGGQLSYSIWWGDENVYTPSMSAGSAMRDYVQSTTFTHAYANAGTYNVTIVVRDSAGQEAKTSSTVKVGSDTVACTLQYDPVCGRPAGCANTCAPGMACPAICQLYAPQTYGNRCQLDAAGAQKLHAGECTSSSGNTYY